MEGTSEILGRVDEERRDKWTSEALIRPWSAYSSNSAAMS